MSPSTKCRDAAESEKSVLEIVFACGLALATIGREALRYPSIRSIDGFSTIALTSHNAYSELGTVILLIGLCAMLVVLSRQHTAKVLFHPAFLLAASSAIAVGFLQRFVFGNADIPLPGILITEMGQFCGYYLFIAWALLAFKFFGASSAFVACKAFVISGIMQAMLTALQQSVALVACSIALLSSALIYAYCYRFARHSFAQASSLEDAGLARTNEQAIFYSSLACFGVLGYLMHYAWQNSAADIGNMLIAQLSGAAGVIALSAISIGVMKKISANRYLLPLTLIAFGLISIATNTASSTPVFLSGYPSLFLLDAFHKAILLLIWLFAFTRASPTSPGMRLTACIFVYKTGTTIPMFFANLPTLAMAAIVVSMSFLLFGILANVVWSAESRVDASRAKRPPLLSDDLLHDGAKATSDSASANVLEEPWSGNSEINVTEVLFESYLASHFGLTKRECELLPLLLSNMSTEEIADHLIVSPETVKTHRHNIYKKLNVSSKSALRNEISDLLRNDFSDKLGRTSPRSDD